MTYEERLFYCKKLTDEYNELVDEQMVGKTKINAHYDTPEELPTAFVEDAIAFAKMISHGGTACIVHGTEHQIEMAALYGRDLMFWLWETVGSWFDLDDQVWECPLCDYMHDTEKVGLTHKEAMDDDIDIARHLLQEHREYVTDYYKNKKFLEQDEFDLPLLAEEHLYIEILYHGDADEYVRSL